MISSDLRKMKVRFWIGHMENAMGQLYCLMVLLNLWTILYLVWIRGHDGRKFFIVPHVGI